MPPIAATHPLRSWIDRIYGPAVFARATPQPRVMHVTALVQDGEALATLRIGPKSPRSTHDWFALQFARARADAIVVTGQLLRDEPHLDFKLRGPASQALGHFRSVELNKTQPPKILLLTRGRGLPWAHPLFASDNMHIVTDKGGADEIAGAPLPDGAGPSVHAIDAPSLEACIAFARAELDATCVSIEAGPNTSRHAYTGEGLVDELLLSVYEGGPLDPALLTRAPFTASSLARQLPHASAAQHVVELSGRWRFERRTRSP